MASNNAVKIILLVKGGRDEGGVTVEKWKIPTPTTRANKRNPRYLTINRSTTDMNQRHSKL
jgi:hypothetical protein